MTGSFRRYAAVVGVVLLATACGTNATKDHAAPSAVATTATAPLPESPPTPPATTSTSAPTATPSPTPTSTPSPTSVTTIDLICGNIHPDVDFTVHKIKLSKAGVPDFKALWSQKLMCDNTDGMVTVRTSVPVITPLQKAVAAAARRAGYGRNDAMDLYAVYENCGSNDPTDPYATMHEFSKEQIPDLRALLALCPNHPQAPNWKRGIAASMKGLAAERSGRRVYDGTYNVPSQMRRGTFVVKDVQNCYWETRDDNGNILDNNFVVAAPQVVATVTSRAVVFTSEGCGEWNRQ